MGFRRWARMNVLSHVKKLTRKSDIDAYFNANPVRKINVGCGSNTPSGWLNADLFPRPESVYLDAGVRWPFPDGAFQYLLCEHMIEHVPKSLGKALISEAFRTLAPGGKARFVTPDLTFFTRMVMFPEERAAGEPYRKVVAEFFGLDQPSWGDLTNLCFYEHGHQYIYSPEELRSILEEAGFVDIQQNRAGTPIDPAFANVEGHVKIIGAEANALEAFALEVTKPSDA